MIRSVASPTPKTDVRLKPGMLPLLSFPLGDAHYAIEVSRVQEVIRPGQLVRIPETAACVRGLINLRGAVVPVFDLAVMLALPQVDAVQREVVLVSGGVKRVGLLIAGQCEVVHVPCERISPRTSPTMPQRPYVAATATSGTHSYFLIDIDDLIDELPQTHSRGGC